MFCTDMPKKGKRIPNPNSITLISGIYIIRLASSPDKENYCKILIRATYIKVIYYGLNKAKDSSPLQYITKKTNLLNVQSVFAWISILISGYQGNTNLPNSPYKRKTK